MGSAANIEEDQGDYIAELEAELATKDRTEKELGAEVDQLKEERAILEGILGDEQMKLFVWDEVFCTYGSPGIAFALAHTKKEAVELIRAKVLEEGLRGIRMTVGFHRKAAMDYVDSLLTAPHAVHDGPFGDFLEADAG